MILHGLTSARDTFHCMTTNTLTTHYHAFSLFAVSREKFIIVSEVESKKEEKNILL